MLPIRLVRIATIMSPISITAQSGVSSPSTSPAAAGEFDQRDEECTSVWKRNMRLDHGLLQLAELRWHEQFSAAGNAEEDTGEDTCCCHRDPFGRAELGKYALNQVLHPLRPPRLRDLGCTECLAGLIILLFPASVWKARPQYRAVGELSFAARVHSRLTDRPFPPAADRSIEGSDRASELRRDGAPIPELPLIA